MKKQETANQIFGDWLIKLNTNNQHIFSKWRNIADRLSRLEKVIGAEPKTGISAERSRRPKTSRPMKIGIYNRSLPTLGGGERHSLSLAEHLSHNHDTTFISHEKVTPEAVKAKLNC